MVFINSTDTLGIIINSGVNNIFGSVTIMIFIVIMLILAVAFAFKMPIELTIPLVLPLIIYSMASYGEIIPLGGLMLFYLSFVFAKYFMSYAN